MLFHFESRKTGPRGRWIRFQTRGRTGGGLKANLPTLMTRRLSFSVNAVVYWYPMVYDVTVRGMIFMGVNVIKMVFAGMFCLFYNYSRMVLVFCVELFFGKSGQILKIFPAGDNFWFVDCCVVVIVLF